MNLRTGWHCTFLCMSPSVFVREWAWSLALAPAHLPSITSSSCSVKPRLFHHSSPDCCSFYIYIYSLCSSFLLYFFASHFVLLVLGVLQRIIKPAASPPHAIPPSNLHSPASPPPLHIPPLFKTMQHSNLNRQMAFFFIAYSAMFYYDEYILNSLLISFT